MPGKLVAAATAVTQVMPRRAASTAVAPSLRPTGPTFVNSSVKLFHAQFLFGYGYVNAHSEKGAILSIYKTNAAIPHCVD